MIPASTMMYWAGMGFIGTMMSIPVAVILTRWSMTHTRAWIYAVEQLIIILFCTLLLGFVIAPIMGHLGDSLDQFVDWSK